MHCVPRPSAACCRNGYYLATGAADATVKLWDLRKLKNFHTTTPAAGGPIGGLHFDLSGQFLAVGSNDLRSVVACTHALYPLHPLGPRQHPSSTTHHRVCPSCALLFRAHPTPSSPDPFTPALASVYESKTWSTVASYADHEAAVTGVGFGRSASTLVATAADGIVKHYGAAS